MRNDATFVAFYNMCAVTFVLPHEMADVSIAGLQWFEEISRNEKKRKAQWQIII